MPRLCISGRLTDSYTRNPDRSYAAVFLLSPLLHRSILHSTLPLVPTANALQNNNNLEKIKYPAWLLYT